MRPCMYDMTRYATTRLQVIADWGHHCEVDRSPAWPPSWTTALTHIRTLTTWSVAVLRYDTACSQYKQIVIIVARAGFGVKWINPLRFLAGCRNRWLNQALSVLSLSIGYFWLIFCCLIGPLFICVSLHVKVRTLDIAPLRETSSQKHSGIRVWHVFSRDLTVLPAHPQVYPQSEWAKPTFAFPAIAGTHLSTPEGWKAELAWVAGYVVRQFTFPKAVTHPMHPSIK